VRGVTLVELMVALVLGLVITGAALALFATNKRTYVTSENLGRIQENSRTAFELLAREMRQANGNGCDNSNPANTPTANFVLRNNLASPGTQDWTTQWGLASAAYATGETDAPGMQGYGAGTTNPFPAAAVGTGTSQQVAGTDAIVLRASTDLRVVDVESTSNTADIEVTDASGLQANDVLVLCDYYGAAVFRATAVNTGTGAISHVALTKGVKPPGTPPAVWWVVNAQVGRLRSTGWYVGCNGRVACDQPGGRSLFRVDGGNGPDEIAQGVRDMGLSYLPVGGNAYVTAATIGDEPEDWANIAAIKIDVQIEGSDRVGTDGNPITRTFEHVVSIRNHTL
jgi:type IV pilus assembly protein PilW